MNRNVKHSPEVSVDTQLLTNDPGTNKSESTSHSDTALLLKSFIKENLRASHESTGGASSSDDSLDMTSMRYDSGVNFVERSMRNVATPEPQPLTRSNVTLHDGIWRTDLNEDQNPSSSNIKPVSLSPPLKGLQMTQESDNGTPRAWTRGMHEYSLSDADSDQSYSSQDTMILKTSKEAAHGHLRYLEMFESAQADAHNSSRAYDTLPISVRPSRSFASHSVIDQMFHSKSRQEKDKRHSPSLHVRFSSEVEFQEVENDYGAEAALPHRSLNVDYSQILGRSSGDGDQPEHDDGYESTDNASSTSSSSNSIEQQSGGLHPEASRDSPDNTSAVSGSLKTDYGYVDCTKLPSFRRMNMELRKKAVIKSAANVAKNTVEDKLKALCIESEDNYSKDDEKEQRFEGDYDDVGSTVGSLLSSQSEFEPRDASSPLSYSQSPSVDCRPKSNSMYQIGNLDIISNQRDNNQAGETLYSNNKDTKLTADDDYSKVSEIAAVGRLNNDFTDGLNDNELQPCESRWENRIPAVIPEQPRRPAPILRNNSSIQSFYSSGNINAIYAERSMVPSERPLSEIQTIYKEPYLVDDGQRPASEMYNSQPYLQMDYSNENLGGMSRFKSEPQLQREDFFGAGANDSFEKGTNLTENQDAINLQNTEASGNFHMSQSAIGTTEESPYSRFEQCNSPNPDNPFSSNREYWTHSPQYSDGLTKETFAPRPQSPARSVSPSRSLRSDDIGSDVSNQRLPQHAGHIQRSNLHQNPNLPTIDDFSSNYNAQPSDIPGVYVYRSSPPQVHPTTSDEQLNMSGSTGSNDSGIDHNSADNYSSNTIPHNMYPTDVQGRRAPVNYTLDDTSRDPMGLIEKVKRRRDASPIRRFQTSPTPLSKNSEKGPIRNPLLCQAGEFTTPSSKELSRMRTLNRASPSGSKLQPMKALPIFNNQGRSATLDSSAKRMLNSQGIKMREDYARYLQLYSKYQQQNSESKTPPPEQYMSDATADRRSSSPESYSSSSGYAENFSNTPDANSESNSGIRSSQKSQRPTSSVLYMRTADIYKMLEEQRGTLRKTRSQPTTPTKTTAPEWETIQMEKTQRMNNSFESLQSHSSENNVASSTPHAYRYDNEEPQKFSLSGHSIGGATTAKNADIYSLYTGTAQRRQNVGVARERTKPNAPDDSSTLHV